jgi:flagella basal body P-ring formation protein FlgA
MIRAKPVLRPSFNVRFLVLAAGLTYLWPHDAHAANMSPFADLAAIDAQVASFTGHATGQSGGASMPVDRRLRINACRSPVAVSWRAGRRDSVLVECPDPGSWRLFVPVRQAEAGAAGAVAIARGESVNIAVVGEGFSVSQAGEAMDSGSIGDWIRVRGLKNGTAQGEPMRAQITRPGTVEVQMRD